MIQVKNEEDSLPEMPDVEPSQGQGLIKFLPETTKNLPSLCMTSTQLPPLLCDGPLYYEEKMLQKWYITQLPGETQRGHTTERTWPAARGLLNNMAMVEMNNSTTFPACFTDASGTPTASTNTTPPLVPDLETNRVDGRVFWAPTRHPGHSADLPAYQLRDTGSSFSQEFAGDSSHCSMEHYKFLLKRESRLTRNRKAARECRLKKKEYIRSLEERAIALESVNNILSRELKAMRDIFGG
ncbi:cAMP-responsive element modulator-like [Pungitius pungitius]|uniref:cAMP-responsive element modulator-like n=1 Tax=Pungitius pungitius TaxID=134920 RepID=UPI002E130687